MSSERQKHRQAALKAWETIRRKHKEQRVNGVEKLTQWIDAEKIGKIPHPEILEEPVKEPWCARARAQDGLMDVPWVAAIAISGEQ